MTSATENSGIRPADIELINAHGPYNHGVWSGKGVTITAEEGLSGRAEMLLNEIRSSIGTHYGNTPLSSLTVLDVGCYDGWVLHHLSALPFKRLVGVEPRTKNIDKGRMIRHALGIDSRCDFIQGGIDTLGDVLNGETFDIVICTGLLHHLASPSDGLAKLRPVCRGLLFVETICLPATRTEARLERMLELKDIVYFFGSKRYGLTAQKLETAYYDGSAAGFSVVGIPSIDTLLMSLEVVGFTDARVVVDPETYGSRISGWRSFDAVCLTARPAPDQAPKRMVNAWVEEYERGLLSTLLPDRLVELLHARLCREDIPERAERPPPWTVALVERYVRKGGWQGRLCHAAIRRLVSDRYGRELVKNLRFNPVDKVNLEYGKLLYARGTPAEAAEVLLQITRRLNADWRSVYRACCLLSWCYRATGDESAADRYAELCRLANPSFPDTLLTDKAPDFHPLDFSLA